jgi:hypothetical protein
MNDKLDSKNNLKTNVSSRTLFKTISSNQINADLEYSKLLPKLVVAKKSYFKKAIFAAIAVLVLVATSVSVIVYASTSSTTKSKPIVLPIQESAIKPKTVVKGNTATNLQINFSQGSIEACNTSNLTTNSNIGTAAISENLDVALENVISAHPNNVNVTVVAKDGLLYVKDFVSTGLYYISSTNNQLTYCFNNNNNFSKSEISLEGNSLFVYKEVL